jgi:glycerophosphoryl diester phosphodiesterase
VAIEADGRQVLLKWHCLRRRAADPAFARANLLAGLATGAALEVDLVATADGAFVCLHDLTLDAETTGSGPVVAQPAAAVLALRQRDPTGWVLASTVLGFEELTRLVRACPPPGPPDGRIQLDLKEGADGITPAVERRFAAALEDIGAWFTLSGESWPAVARLAALVPDLVTGFDPDEAIGQGLAGAAVARHALATAPEAAIYYLRYGFVLACLARGCNPLAPLRAAGKRIDCWTIDADEPDLVAKLKALIAAGADQITTNEPERLARRWQAARGA